MWKRAYAGACIGWKAMPLPIAACWPRVPSWMKRVVQHGCCASSLIWPSRSGASPAIPSWPATPTRPCADSGLAIPRPPPTSRSSWLAARYPWWAPVITCGPWQTAYASPYRPTTPCSALTDSDAATLVHACAITLRWMRAGSRAWRLRSLAARLTTRSDLFSCNIGPFIQAKHSAVRKTVFIVDLLAIPHSCRHPGHGAPGGGCRQVQGHHHVYHHCRHGKQRGRGRGRGRVDYASWRGYSQISADARRPCPGPGRPTGAVERAGAGVVVRALLAAPQGCSQCGDYRGDRSLGH